jgi:hypothetical protein
MQQEQTKPHVLPFMIFLLFPNPLSASQIPRWRGAQARRVPQNVFMTPRCLSRMDFASEAADTAAADSVHF